MKITVIPEDNTIVVDGDGRRPDGAVYPEGVRAIQWNGDIGAIEYHQAPQQSFTDFAAVAPFLALHAAAKARDEIPVVLPPPTPIEQIRIIERTPEVSDAMQRGTRLVAIAYAIDDLIRIAAAKGLTVTRQQAHDWAMLNDANYKTLHDAEQAIKPLRPLV